MLALIKHKTSGDVFVIDQQAGMMTQTLHYTEWQQDNAHDVDTPKVESATWATDWPVGDRGDFDESDWHWLHEWTA